MKKTIKKFTSGILAVAITLSTALNAPHIFALRDEDYENAVDFQWYTKISETTISPIDDQTYTGSLIKPNISIKYKSKSLVKGKDYTVTYKNNKYIGTASATIKGINDYTGTKTISFKIIPKTVTNLKAKSTSSTITLNWSKVSSVSGYEIYRATSKAGSYSKIKTITSSSTLSYKDCSVSKSKVYYYKVRAYKTVSGKKYYGKYSSVVAMATTLAKPTITVKSSSAGTIKVTWNKIPYASGYEIYRKIGTNAVYTKLTTITTPSTISYTNKNLKKNNKYYYKVRAYRLVDGKKVYGSFSTVKYATCK